ncbi:MAG: hypothetical protein HQL87_11310 [Magnetococcales bacterium]|nr:hypothetical protein [Magnetococcales bacterium]
MKGLPNGLNRPHNNTRQRSTLRAMPVCLALLALLNGGLGVSAWGVQQAAASETAAAAKPEAAKPAAAKPEAAKPAVASKEKEDLGDKAAGVGDPAGLLNSLEQRRQELEKRAKWLDLREADLKRLEEKLAKRIASLEALRTEIRTNLDKEKVVDDTNITRLAKILSGMKAKSAADGLKAMDRDTAVLVLKVMKEKVAAKILSKMDTEQAGQMANELGIPMAEKKHN